MWRLQETGLLLAVSSISICANSKKERLILLDPHTSVASFDQVLPIPLWLLVLVCNQSLYNQVTTAAN